MSSSYQYMLFGKRPFVPTWWARVRVLLGRYEPIGQAETVKQALTELFPQISWREEKFLGARPDYPVRDDMAIMAGPTPRIQFCAMLDGNVRTINASDIDSKQLRAIERRLKVVTINTQHESFFQMIIG